MSINVGILDADSLYFRICFKTKKTSDIRKLIRSKLTEIEGACLMPDVMRIAVKGRNNFRHDLYDKYKAHRPELEPDMKKALGYAHEYLVGEHGAIQADGMEADDLVSIWAQEARELGYAYTICGIDKDLLQIPGIHYNFDKKTYREVDVEEGYKLLMLQSLTGDNSDNIPGIKGIGPKKAEKLLAGVPTERLWNAVKTAWQGTGATPDLSYSLLRMITTWEEYNEIRAYVSSEPRDRKSDERPLSWKSPEPFQNVQRVSERDSGRTDGEGLAIREEPSESTGSLRSEQSGEGSGQPEQTTT